jgi:hypothetical protein
MPSLIYAGFYQNLLLFALVFLILLVHYYLNCLLFDINYFPLLLFSKGFRLSSVATRIILEQQQMFGILLFRCLSVLISQNVALVICSLIFYPINRVALLCDMFPGQWHRLQFLCSAVLGTDPETSK